MKEQTEPTEIEALRRTTRDIIALSTFPSIWIRQSAAQVADSLAESVVRTLRLVFAYVKIVTPENRVETSYSKRGFLNKPDLIQLANELDPLIEDGSAAHWATSLSSFNQFGLLQIYATPIGPNVKNGVLIVGSAGKNFLTDTERLVLNIAKNQVHVTIQHKWAHDRAEKLRAQAEASENRLRCAHAAAEYERQKLEAIFDRSPSFLAVLRGPDLVYEKVNSRYYDLVGNRQLIGHRFIDALPEMRDQEYGQILQHVFQTGETFVGSEMMFEFQRIPGRPLEKRYVDIVYQRIPDGSGIHCIFAHGIDVSDKVTARQEIEKSRENYRLLFDNNPLPMWIFDPLTLKFLNVNETAIRCYGYSKHEFLSMSMSDISAKGDDGKVRHLKKDGTIIYVEVSTHAMVLNGGNVLMAAAKDITKRVEFENKQQDLMDTLQAAKDEAERANALKSSFLANMSHEIRTPLGVMMGFTDLILEPDLSMEDRLEYAGIMRRNGEQLLIIIDDILDLSKVEAGYLKVDELEFSLIELLEDILSNFKVKAAEKGLSLQLKLKGSLQDRICSDPARLKQILLNLISNSIKFTANGHVILTVEAQDGRLTFDVSDTGIGIAAHDQAKLFKPFTQADGSSTRIFGGTGLGLALSKRLAALLGGSLTLKSSIFGCGSSFVLTLPNRSKSEESHSSSSEKETVNSSVERGSLKNIKVLLVEDSPDNRQLISRVLAKKVSVIDIAENGILGMEKALKGSYDIVLMDVQMPMMDGYTAAQNLRAQGYRKPIIALTAHAMSETRKKCLNVGYTDYLPKPVNFNELIAKVEQYCRN